MTDNTAAVFTPVVTTHGFAPDLPKAIAHGGFAGGAGALWLAGGEVVTEAGAQSVSAAVFQCFVGPDLQPAQDAWTSLTSLPTARVAPSVRVIGQTLYVLGGSTTIAGTETGVLEAFDLTAGTWTTLAAMPHPRWAAFDFVDGAGNWHIVGGRTAAGNPASHDVYDVSANTWSNLADCPFTTTQYSATAGAVMDNAVYVYANGGQFYSWDLAAQTWASLPCLANINEPGPVVALDGFLFMFGSVAGNPQAFDPACSMFNHWSQTWSTVPNISVELQIRGTAVALQQAGSAQIYFAALPIAAPATRVEQFGFATAAPMISTQTRLAQSAIAYFPLDGDYTSTLDSTVALFPTGAPVFGPRWDGRLACSFLQAADYLTVPNLGWTGGSASAFTIALWFRARDFQTPASVWYDAEGVMVTVTSTNVQMSMATGQSWNVPLAAPAQPDHWMHLAVVASGGGPNEPAQVSVYIDGAKLGTQGTNVFPGPAFRSATIGAYNHPGLTVCNITAFSSALGDDDVLFLAADLFHPEGAFAGAIQYFALTPNGTPLTCADDPALNVAKAANGLTICAWFDTDEIDLAILGEQVLFARTGAFSLGLTADGLPKVVVNAAQGGPWTFTGPNAVGGSKWCYLAVSIGAETINLYMDGVLQRRCLTDSYADVPVATLTIADTWLTSIYSLAIYGSAFDVNAVQALALLDDLQAQSDPGLLVYYDLSTAPPRVIPSTTAPGLGAPITVPADVTYEEYARGLMVTGNACIDGGYATDTLIDPATMEIPAAIFSAWLSPTRLVGVQTVLSRFAGGFGYGLYLNEGYPELRIYPQNAAAIVLKSPVAIPAKRFCQIGAKLVADPSGNQYFGELIVNGRSVANQTLSVASVVALADPEIPFIIGAESSRDPVALAPLRQLAQRAGLSALVQSVLLYDDMHIDYYDLYYAPEHLRPVSPRGAWLFDGAMPTDVTGNHTAIALNGAAISEITAPNLELTPSADFAAARQAAHRCRFDPYPGAPVVAENALHILESRADWAGRVTVHDVDGVVYLVSHELDGETVRARCVLASKTIDATTAAWIAAAVVVMGVMGYALFKLSSFDTVKATNLVTKAVTEGEEVREALYALQSVSGASMGGAVLGILQALYNFGVLRKILECFGISWFSVLKFLSYLAPYAGQILLGLQLAQCAVQMYDAFKTKKPDLDTKPPSPRAVPSVTSLTVNGDPISVSVILDGPPAEGSVTVECTTVNLNVEPTALTFTTANFAIPQTVTVSKTSGNANAEVDGKVVSVMFGGAGLASSAECDLTQRVAKIVWDPERVTLTPESGAQKYSAQFEILVTAPIPSGTTLTYSFTVDGKPSGETPYSFTEIPDPAAVDPRKRRFEMSVGSSDVKKPKVEVRTVASATPAGSAGDDAMADVEVDIAADEIITLTMVNGSSGNCFVLRNVNTEDDETEIAYAVLDGGMPGTYARMQGYLPTAGIDPDAWLDLYCSHYDADHIGGLIELMTDPAQVARVRTVFFNPPPALAMEMAAGHPADIGLKNLQSIAQGVALAGLAAGRRNSPKGYEPPPETAYRPARLPSIDIQMAGPSTYVWNLLAETRPAKKTAYSKYVNRASLAFLLASRKSGFRMMQTGDGYGSAKFQDLAEIDDAVPMLDFFQVPHHGSRNNSSEILFRRYPAKNYLISTNFTTFKHPHQEMLNFLFSANAARPDAYNVYINASSDLAVTMRNKYIFQPGNYTVYLRSAASTGVQFSYVDGQVQPRATDIVQLFP